MLKICDYASQFAEIIPALIDISDLRLPDGSDDWEAETPLVRELLGSQLDAVYSSEESYGDYFAKPIRKPFIDWWMSNESIIRSAAQKSGIWRMKRNA